MALGRMLTGMINITATGDYEIEATPGRRHLVQFVGNFDGASLSVYNKYPKGGAVGIQKITVNASYELEIVASDKTFLMSVSNGGASTDIWARVILLPLGV